MRKPHGVINFQRLTVYERKRRRSGRKGNLKTFFNVIGEHLHRYEAFHIMFGY